MSVTDAPERATQAPPTTASGVATTNETGERRRWLEGFTNESRDHRDETLLRESRASWLRLVIFLVGVVVWVVLNQWPLIALGVTVGVVIAFVVAVRRHAALKDEREHLDRLVAACDDTARRLGGAVTCIRTHAPPLDETIQVPNLPPVADDGRVWRLTEQERGDLDLFTPPVGLFGLLNRTSTAIGARRLADALTHPLLDPQRIAARQQSTRALCEAPAQRLRLLAACMSLRDEDKRLAAFTAAVAHAEPLRLFAATGLLRVWSFISAAIILAVIVATATGALSWVWIGPPLLINVLMYLWMRPALMESLIVWRDVTWALRGLLIVARQAERDIPAEGELVALRERFAAVAPRAVLGALSGRLGWAESGGMLQGLLNLVIFCDLHTAHGILKCIVPHRAAILESIAAIAELELRLCSASFAWEQPVTCWPRPCDETRVAIRGGRHPLVDPEHVVANDVMLDDATRLWIVTGSNMAGKSTFLRMTAVNTLLAQFGTVALAAEMSWRPLRLLTDLRAADNIVLNESYFLAEVRHLRRLIVPDDDDAPVLGLIDEPFRGTNSQDQSAASVAVVRHLLTTRNLYLLATHDRHLTELADGDAARNCHFQENLGQDGMVFDYRLYDGPATTRNALRVLEREGYPGSLLDAAQGWLAEHAGDET